MHASGATKIFPGAIKEKLVFNYIEIEIVCKTKGKKKSKTNEIPIYSYTHKKRQENAIETHRRYSISFILRRIILINLSRLYKS